MLVVNPMVLMWFIYDCATDAMVTYLLLVTSMLLYGTTYAGGNAVG
jgi:hypothetical protein